MVNINSMQDELDCTVSNLDAEDMEYLRIMAEKSEEEAERWLREKRQKEEEELMSHPSLREETYEGISYSVSIYQNGQLHPYHDSIFKYDIETSAPVDQDTVRDFLKHAGLDQGMLPEEECQEKSMDMGQYFLGHYSLEQTGATKWRLSGIIPFCD